MKRSNVFSFVAALCVITVAALLAAQAAEGEGVLEQIDRIASLGEKAPDSLYESTRDAIEADPKGVSAALLEKLKSDTLPEGQLMTYVWALGLAREESATDTVIGIYRKSESEPVRHNCLRSLANIGGPKAGEFLLSVLDGTTDKETRFEMLNLLAQMKHEAALPKTYEILQLDPEQYYWQSNFIFGKMGDKAVAYLAGKIGDENRNVRVNAIAMLGQWLLASDATRPLQDRYWLETDPEVRGMILSALEATIADWPVMKQFFQEVVAREKNEGPLTFARETLEGFERLQADVEAFAGRKAVSAERFQRECAQLMKSAGKKGDYDVLAASSTVDDEPALKALRERVLQRDSDESFYDYQEINNIILRNRLLRNLAREKTAQP